MNDQSLGQFRNHRPVAWGGDWIGARKRQEDAHAFFDMDGLLCCIVCDGMGGHVGGQVASQLAVEAASNALANPGRADIPGRLRDALAAANRRVGKEVRDRPDLKGMGATFVAVAIDRRRVHWISVGDSPLYQAGPGALLRLNADHSLRTELEEQARRGAITAEAARTHPNRNALTSAVMGDEITIYDLNSTEIVPGSRIVIASDGIETLPDAEIERLAGGYLNHTPEALGTALIGAVQARGKPNQDNTTVLVIDPVPNMKSRPLPFYQRMGGGTWMYGAVALAAVCAAVLLVLVLSWMLGTPEGDTFAQPANGPKPRPVVEESAAEPCRLDGVSDADKQALCTCVSLNPDSEVANSESIGEEIRLTIQHCKTSGGDLPNAGTDTPDPDTDTDTPKEDRSTEQGTGNGSQQGVTGTEAAGDGKAKLPNGQAPPANDPQGPEVDSKPQLTPGVEIDENGKPIPGNGGAQ